MSKESLLYPKLKEWILESYPSAWIYRTTDTFRVGIPDILACIDGRLLAIEVKATEAHHLTKIQEYELGQIAQAGGIAFSVKGETAYLRSGKEVKWREHTLKELLDGETNPV